jgi:hypothetical protein
MKIFEVVNLDEGPTNKIDTHIALKYPELAIERLISQATEAKQKYENNPGLGKGWITGALTEIDNLCSAALSHSTFWKDDSPEVEEAYNRYITLFNENQDYLDELA